MNSKQYSNLYAELDRHLCTTERREMLRQLEAHAGDLARAELAATKGREEKLLAALVGLVDYERRRYPPKMGGDEYPPSLRKVMAVADAALAEKPEGETT